MANLLLLVLALFGAALAVVTGGLLVATYLLAGEVRLFLKAPSYYIRKLTAGPDPEKRAKQVVARIHKLLPARSAYADDLRARVDAVVPAIRRMVQQQDQINIYLEYDVYRDQLAARAGSDDADAVGTLEKRKEALAARLEVALTDLKRIETRVAAHVLAAQDSWEEGAVRTELGDTLDDLKALLEEDRSAGLLPE